MDGPRAQAALLAVALKQDSEQVAEIVRLLADLGVVAEHLAGRRTGEGRIVVRVPRGRVLDAVLALNYHGFADVRVYEVEP